MDSSTWKTVVVWVVGLFGLCLHQQAMAQDLIIVGTGSTMEASQDWLSFLETQEVPCVVVNPAEFGEHKKGDYVVVIGSMDESEDIKAILKEVLTTEEMDWISQPGNGNMYVKTDVWIPGQKVIVIAGSHQIITEQARKATREDWFELLTDWFDIETTDLLRAY
jgi:uncharacterized protein YgbK (DUF1537 family)